MLICTPQKFSESFYLIHSPDFCIYYFKGEVGAICETGVPQINGQIKNNLENFEINPQEVKYIIIMHSHFDHSGGVSALKEIFPKAQVIGSKNTKYILADNAEIQKIIKGIKKTSDAEPYKTYLKQGASEFIEPVDIVEVKDEQVIDLGNGINLKIIYSPGHSPCGISIYEEKNNCLLFSDNCGSIYPLLDVNTKIPNLRVENNLMKKITVWPTPFFSFSQYKESQRKLASFNAEKLGFGHLGILSNKAAKNYFSFNKKITDDYKDHLLEILKTKDNEQIISELAQKRFADLLYFFPLFIFKWGTRATLDNLIKEMELKKSYV